MNNNKSQALFGIFRGIVSGGTAALICAPLDILKTQYQVRKYNKTLLDSGRQIYNKNGILGFYRGAGSNILAMASFYGVFFPIYHFNKQFVKKLFPDINQPLQHITASISAGIGASLFANPFHVLKTRYHTEKTKISPSISGLIRKIYQKEGFRSFYRGLGVTYFKNIELGIQLPIYEYIKSNTPITYALAAFIAKMTATTVTFPLDTIRTNRRRNSNLSIFEIINKIKSERGLFGFYKGYHIYLLRSLPSSVIAFMVYESLRTEYK